MVDGAVFSRRRRGRRPCCAEVSLFLLCLTPGAQSPRSQGLDSVCRPRVANFCAWLRSSWQVPRAPLRVAGSWHVPRQELHMGWVPFSKDGGRSSSSCREPSPLTPGARPRVVPAPGCRLTWSSAPRTAGGPEPPCQPPSSPAVSVARLACRWLQLCHFSELWERTSLRPPDCTCFPSVKSQSFSPSDSWEREVLVRKAHVSSEVFKNSFPQF